MIDSPVVSVHMPGSLRAHVDGHEEITVSGDTVGDLLEAIVHEYPAIRSHLLSPEGGLAPRLALYLGGRSIGELQGLATPDELEEVLSIVPTR